MANKGQEKEGISKNGEPCLLFALGGEAFAIRIDALREIISPEGMRALPSPDFRYWGHLNFRGQRIPVLRISDFFQYPAPTGESISVLVMGSEKTPYGLLVDMVKGVWNIRSKELSPLPPLATYLDPHFFQGIGRGKAGALFLLNEERLSQMQEIRFFYKGQEDTSQDHPESC